MKSSFTSGVSHAISKTQQMASQVTSGIRSMSSSAISGVADMVSNISGKFNDLVSGALSWGRDMVGNFASGVRDKMNSLLDEVKSLASQVTSYLHFTVPDKGPLAKADTWMPDFMELLATGIDNNKYLVTKAAQGLALDMSAIMAEPFSYDDMYSAVRDGASSATTRIILNDREVTRALSNMGVAFNG
jgi:phage-related protein